MASNQVIKLFNKQAVAINTAGTPATVLARTGELLGLMYATNVNAATTIKGKIEHSPDGVEWFDLCNFDDVVGSATPKQLKIIQGPVMGNVRASVVLSGGTMLADIKIDLCVNPSVY